MNNFKEVVLPPTIKLSEHLNKEMIAYYTGKRKIENTKNDSGESLIHTFQEKDGTEIEVWSFEQLKRKLSKVPIGSLTKIIYTGSESDGVKNIHQVKVMFDEKDKIKVE